jgi:toxin ParE1/3/4
LAIAIRLSAKARLDLRQIYFDGAERFGRIHARRYLQEIYAPIARLSDFPSLGHSINSADPSKRQLSHPPYLVVYEPRDRELVILRVLHARQLPPDAL